MTVVFEAQPFIIFARGVACRVCSDDFIIIVRESRLLTSLCMDDVVERVTQHGPPESFSLFEAGRGIPDEEAWDDLEEELALEKQELEMAEAI